MTNAGAMGMVGRMDRVGGRREGKGGKEEEVVVGDKDDEKECYQVQQRMGGGELSQAAQNER